MKDCDVVVEGAQLRWLRSQGDWTLFKCPSKPNNRQEGTASPRFREGLVSVVVADVLVNKAQGCSTSRRSSYSDST